MRAALIVKSCSSCLATSTSGQGSVVDSACECPAGAYRFSSAADQRAIALVPGRAQFSTLANRGLRNYAATAQFSSTAGPAGSKGAVTFDRAVSLYLDSGSHQFNVGTNGFTAVAVVRFTAVGAWESIIDMGKGMSNDNIDITRVGSTTQLSFSIYNGNSECSVRSATGALVLNTWLTIVATYDHNDRNLKMRIGSTIATNIVCDVARTNRNVVNTYVSRSNWGGGFISGSIAGLYAVDALLTEEEIGSVVSRINAGEDTLQACAGCPANTFKAGAGNALSACEACPANSNSAAGSPANTACQCNAGYAGDGISTPTTIYDFSTISDHDGFFTLLASSGGLVSAPAESIPWIEWILPPGFAEFEIWFSYLGAYGDLELSLNGVFLMKAVQRSSTVQVTKLQMLYVSGDKLRLTQKNGVQLSANQLVLKLFGAICTACAAGTFKAVAGAGGCETCPVDSFSPPGSELQTACQCNPGFSGADGGACSACAAGTFKNASGSSACSPCPEFAESPTGSTHGTNCTCAGGYRGVPGGLCGLVCPPGAAHGPLNQVCYPCGTSTYKPLAGDHACTPCPPFSHHGLTNQTSVDACACQIGYLWNAGTQGCEQCPSGTFNNRAGDTRCFPCVSSIPQLGLGLQDLSWSCGVSGTEQCPCYGSPYTEEDDYVKHCDFALAKTKDLAHYTQIQSSTLPWRVTIDFGKIQHMNRLVFKNSGYVTPVRQNSLNHVYVLAGGWCGIPRYPVHALATDCRCPRADEVFDQAVLLPTDFNSLNAKCTAGYLGHFMSPDVYKHVPGIDMTYSQEDIELCWEGDLSLLTSYSINLPTSCVGRYLHIQPRESGVALLDQITVYGPPLATCAARESDGTSCPGLCVAPAGFQATAWGANVEACPANAYQDGSGVQCAPCPAPSTFTAHGGLASVAECACTAGHSRVSGVCVACAAGSYKAAPGAGTCVLCVGDTTTQEPGSTSLAECVCDADFELVNAVCRRCVAPAAKHHPGNEACISCGVGGALDPAEPHNQTSCECQAGYAGDWRGCAACAVGYHKSGVGEGPCVKCAEHATTAQAASASIADCRCSPPELWEPGPAGGPDVPGGSCVSACLAGATGGAGACEPCPAGTFKPEQGPAACTPCPAPTTDSDPGSTLATDCTCHAGFLEDPGSDAVTVLSLGGLSLEDMDSSEACPGRPATCSVPASPAHRLHALVLAAADGEELRDVTVLVSHLGTVLTLFLCTIDCVPGAPIALEGLLGTLEITATGYSSATLTRHTRRTAAFSPSPNTFTHAQAEQAVLRHRLRVGDALWASVEGGDVQCVECVQGLVCL